MASSPNHLTLLFLLFAISSLQVHARDNQLFSKFHHTSINNAKETEVIPQTDMTSGIQGDDQPSNPVKETYNGYGLYGRGTDQFPTTTNEASLTSSSLTKKMPSDEFYNDQSFESNDNNNKVNKNYGEEPKQYGLSDTRYQDNTNYYYNNNNNNVNKNREEPKQYGLSDTWHQDNTNYYYNNNDNNVNKNREVAKQYSFSDTRYQDNSNNNNDNYYYYRNNNNNNNGYPVVKQQGMSDTRFVENGKYYYDVNNEINFDPNEYHFRGMNMNLRNKYNTNGAYNGNNEMDSYQEDAQNEETQQEFLP